MSFERENQLRRSANLNNEMPSVMRVKFFITVAGPDDTPYPEEAEAPEDNPNVYYCRMLKNPTYLQEVGKQVLGYGVTDVYKFVFNLESRNYIEEGSIIEGHELYNRWWTIDKVVTTAPIIVHLTKIDLVTGELIYQTNQITTREYIDTDGTDVSGRYDLENLAHVADGLTGILRWTNAQGISGIYRGDGFLAQSAGTIVKKIDPADGASLTVDNWPKTLPGSIHVSGLAADRKNAGGIYALQGIDFSQLSADGNVLKTETCAATRMSANGIVMRHMDDAGLLALGTSRVVDGGPVSTNYRKLGFVSDDSLIMVGESESFSDHNAFTADGDYYVRAYGSGGNVNAFDVVVNRLAATLDWSRDDDLSAPIMQMCHDPNGGFYAADTAGNVSHYDSSGNRDWTTSTTLPPMGGGSTSVYDGGISSMISDGNGVAVGNGRGGVSGPAVIHCLSPGGTLTAVVAPGGQSGRFFGMDSTHVYAPLNSSSVSKINRTTGSITTFSASGTPRTLYQVVVGGGNVYANTRDAPGVVYKFSTSGVEDAGFGTGWPKIGVGQVNSMGWNSANNYLCLQVQLGIEQYDSNGTLRVSHNSPGAAGPIRMKLDQFSVITETGIWQNQEGAYFALTSSGHIVPVFKMHGEGLGNRAENVDAACYNPGDNAYYSGGGGRISKVTVSTAEHVCHFDPRDGLSRAEIYSVAISPDKTKVLVHLSVASNGAYGKVVCFDMSGNKLWSSEGVGLASSNNRGTVTSTPGHALVWHTPVLSVL